MFKRLRSDIETFYYSNKYKLLKNSKPLKNLKDVVFKEPIDDKFWNRWDNGWYVNGGGNDDRCKYNYDKKNVTVDSTIHFYSKRSTLKSGCMINTKRMFKYGVFRFKVGLASFHNEKFSFWLKNYSKDVNEVDIVEVEMDGSIDHPLTFTNHTGTNYTTDHKFYPTTVKKQLNYNSPVTIELEWKPDKLVWRVDGVIVKVCYDDIPTEPMGVIIDFGKIGYDNYTSVAKITEIVVAKDYV